MNLSKDNHESLPENDLNAPSQLLYNTENARALLIASRLMPLSTSSGVRRMNLPSTDDGGEAVNKIQSSYNETGRQSLLSSMMLISNEQALRQDLEEPPISMKDRSKDNFLAQKVTIPGGGDTHHHQFVSKQIRSSGGNDAAAAAHRSPPRTSVSMSHKELQQDYDLDTWRLYHRIHQSRTAATALPQSLTNDSDEGLQVVADEPPLTTENFSDSASPLSDEAALVSEPSSGDDFIFDLELG